MSNLNNQPEIPTTPINKNNVSPARCFLGSLISGGLSLGLYHLTYSIAANFASRPVTSSNMLVIKISSAVRTLVMGVSALGTFIFGFVAIGLIALALQLIVQNVRRTTN
jgi:hypothetical protein